MERLNYMDTYFRLMKESAKFTWSSFVGTLENTFSKSKKDDKINDKSSKMSHKRKSTTKSKYGDVVTRHDILQGKYDI